MNQREVTISIYNRKGLGQYTETVQFTTFEALRQRVDQVLEDLDFYKFTIELEANWDLTDEEQKSLHSIEEDE